MRAPYGTVSARSPNRPSDSDPPLPHTPLAFSGADVQGKPGTCDHTNESPPSLQARAAVRDRPRSPDLI